MRELIFKAGQKVRETEMEALGRWGICFCPPECVSGSGDRTSDCGLKNISINQKRGMKLQGGIYYISYTTRRGEPAATAVLGFRWWYTVLCACFAFLA